MAQAELLAPSQAALITGDELLAMGDIGPCELVRGRILPMSPTGAPHARYEIKIGSILNAYAEAHRLGPVFGGEVGIYTGHDPDTIRAADVAFVSRENYAQGDASRGFLDVAPDLIVEIMSPDDRWSEVMQKLREYFGIGVRLVWVADPAVKAVYAYRSPTDVREFTENDNLPGDEVLPGFSVPVADLFAD